MAHSQQTCSAPSEKPRSPTTSTEPSADLLPDLPVQNERGTQHRGLEKPASSSAHPENGYFPYLL